MSGTESRPGTVRLTPDDTDWVPLEQHPVFANAMAEYEPPPPKHYPDETRLDMNPLSAERVTELVNATVNAPPNVVAKARSALGSEK